MQLGLQHSQMLPEQRCRGEAGLEISMIIYSYVCFPQLP